MEQPVFTVAEFCAVHRISRTRLYQEWKNGTGPRFFDVGAKILIRRRGCGRLAARARGRGGQASRSRLIGAGFKSGEEAAQRADAGDPPKSEQLPGRLDFDAIPILSNFQAAHLARRFGLSATAARIVASLAWEARH